jgi:hypothetical protein
MARNRFLAFRGEPAAYRGYLMLVGGAAAVAKSAAIVGHTVRTGRGGTARQQLGALWSGLFAGIRIAISPAPQAARSTVPSSETPQSPIAR